MKTTNRNWYFTMSIFLSAKILFPHRKLIPAEAGVGEVSLTYILDSDTNNQAEAMRQHRSGPNHIPSLEEDRHMADYQLIISDKIWKDIPGFPGYEINSYGKVRSWNHKNGKRKYPYLRKPFNGREGYLRINLCKNSNVYFISIHTLVLETFIGPCPVGYQCRHLDGNKLNNHYTNLCWGTAKDNAIDRSMHGNGIGEKNPAAKLNNLDIFKIRYQYSQGFSQRKLAMLYKVTQATIHHIVTRKHWQHI